KSPDNSAYISTGPEIIKPTANWTTPRSRFIFLFCNTLLRHKKELLPSNSSLNLDIKNIFKH
ncbi:hypothetical protein, partial [Acinetobacter baumannii]